MATVTTTDQLALEQLYIAYFGRAADPVGFASWTAALASGKDSLANIANEFANSAESKALYPQLGTGSSVITYTAASAFVTAVYQNLYHRNPDSVGLAYFTTRLTPTNSGEIIKGISLGAQGSDLEFIMGQDDKALTYTTTHDATTYTTADSKAVLLWDGYVAGEFDLTTSMDVATAPYFYAPLAWSPGGNVFVNTLQNVDVLTGSGTNPTLDATLGSIDVTTVGGAGATVQPTLNGIQTLNLTFNGSASNAITTLDLQNSTGVKTVNILGITDDQPSVTVKNFTAVPANLSVANTSSPAGTVTFSTLDAAAIGTADATTLTLSNVNIGTLNLNAAATNVAGIENVTLVSTGAANTVGTFSDVDLSALTITGTQNLKITSFAYGNTGKFTTIDGSAATGKLNLTLDTLQNAATAVPFGKTNGNVAFSLSTGSGDDTVNSTIDFGGKTSAGVINDTVSGGTAGFDTLALSNSVTTSFTDNAKYINFDAVTVTRTGSTHGTTELTVDAANITQDPTFTLVNKEASTSYSTADDTIYHLKNLSAVSANAITIKHSGLNAQQVGNDGLLNNLIDVVTPTGTSVGVTIADGTNADPRFNFALNAPTANITITDSDSESNTVQLANTAAHTGTITLTGGVAGQFLNLDAYAGAAGFGIDSTGTAVDPTVTDTAVTSVLVSAAVADANLVKAVKITATSELSDVIVRVGAANQNIQLGAGNDSVIFADRSTVTPTTSGLTIDDTVAGGAGWDAIVLDGSGAQHLGASEWTHLTGIDEIDLVGASNNSSVLGVLGSVFGYGTGSTVPSTVTPFEIIVTNQLVGQSDLGNRIDIINNDGLLAVGSENTAIIDLRPLDGTHNVTFVGPNGDGTAYHAQQVVVENDVTANGGNIINGGDADVVSTYAATAIKTALWYAQAGGNQGGGSGHNNPVSDSNDNILAIYNDAKVTVGDLANTKNFSIITAHNSTAESTVLALDLNDAVVDALVDASHAATAAQRETLNIYAIDNAAAYSTLNVQAGTLTEQSDLFVVGSYGADTIHAGKGNDIIYAGQDGSSSNYGAAYGGLGGDLIYTGGNVTTTLTDAIGSTYSTPGADWVFLGSSGSHTYGDHVIVDAASVLVTLDGFGNTPSSTYDLVSISATSTVDLGAQYGTAASGSDGSGIMSVSAGTSHIDISGGTVHLRDTYGDIITIEAGTVTLSNTITDTGSTSIAGNEWITISGSSSLDLGIHQTGSTTGVDHVTVQSGTVTLTNLYTNDYLDISGGTTTLSSSTSHNIWITGTSTLDLGDHAHYTSGTAGAGDSINVLGTTTVATVNNSTGDLITIIGSGSTNGPSLVLGAAGGADTINASTGFDSIDLGVHGTTGSSADVIVITGSASIQNYSTHIITHDVIKASATALGAVDDLHLDITGFTTGQLTETAVGTAAAPLSETAVIGTTGLSISTSGVITLNAAPTHSGLTLAGEIMNALQGTADIYAALHTGGSNHLAAYNDGVNTWVFDVTSQSHGAVVELVGVSSFAGFSDGTVNNTIHVSQLS